MPAPFAPQLCGFRDGKPKTSDASDTFSVELGQALFETMGVSPDTPAPRNCQDLWIGVFQATSVPVC